MTLRPCPGPTKLTEPVASITLNRNTLAVIVAPKSSVSRGGEYPGDTQCAVSQAHRRRTVPYVHDEPACVSITGRHRERLRSKTDTGRSRFIPEVTYRQGDRRNSRPRRQRASVATARNSTRTTIHPATPGYSRILAVGRGRRVANASAWRPDPDWTLRRNTRIPGFGQFSTSGECARVRRGHFRPSSRHPALQEADIPT